MTRHRALEQDMPGVASSLQAEQVWVQVIDDEGLWGLGRTGFGDPVVSIVENIFAPLLIGADSGAIQLHNDLMWRASLRSGAEGHAALARSAIDLALWDLKGKRLGLPVWSLLGGPVRESIRCYATCDDLEWAIELGFDAFKISNEVHHDDGAKGLTSLAEKVAVARSTVGSEADLMVNPIMSFNVEFTVRLAQALESYHLTWLEEPLQPWDMEGHLALRERIPFMPIATGEDHHGRHSFRRLVELRAVDVLQPDIEWCGGLTEAVRIHAISEAAGIDIAPHVGANTPWGQHFGISMPGAVLGEYWLGSSPGVELEQTNRIPGTPVPVQGRVVPSSAPGFGLEIPDSWIEPK